MSVLYLKVDNDPGSNPISVQSRCFTASAGVNNATDSLGNLSPCTAKTLDYPKKRNMWLDTNNEALLYQREQVGVLSPNVCEKDFEVGGDLKGSSWNGKQTETHGDACKTRLHQPTFHPEGVEK